MKPITLSGLLFRFSYRLVYPALLGSMIYDLVYNFSEVTDHRVLWIQVLILGIYLFDWTYVEYLRPASATASKSMFFALIDLVSGILFLMAFALAKHSEMFVYEWAFIAAVIVLYVWAQHERPVLESQLERVLLGVLMAISAIMFFLVFVWGYCILEKGGFPRIGIEGFFPGIHRDADDIEFAKSLRYHVEFVYFAVVNISYAVLCALLLYFRSDQWKLAETIAKRIKLPGGAAIDARIVHAFASASVDQKLGKEFDVSRPMSRIKSIRQLLKNCDLNDSVFLKFNERLNAHLETRLAPEHSPLVQNVALLTNNRALFSNLNFANENASEDHGDSPEAHAATDENQVDAHTELDD